MKPTTNKHYEGSLLNSIQSDDELAILENPSLKRQKKDVDSSLVKMEFSNDDAP
jgi:hypothetical protein